jgi:hypothetical protein
MNQEPHELATMNQSLIEDIDRYLADGMPVYDLNGDQLGDVKMYSLAAGYLQVGTGPMKERDLYLPFRLIRSIDPHDIFVSECKDVIMARYTEVPRISTVVERQLISGPHGAVTPQTREVQLAPSGYDNSPVVLDSVDLSSIAERLAVGMVVYDARGERLGDITQYDIGRDLMVVEKGIFRPKALLVPLSAIQEIHPGMFTVYLSLARAALVQEHAMLRTDA